MKIRRKGETGRELQGGGERRRGEEEKREE